MALVQWTPTAFAATAADGAGPVPAALEILATSEVTSTLPDVLRTNGVSILFVPMAPGIYARYSVARHMIEIDERWQSADVATLASVIAHEAVHARDSVSGYLTLGGASACIGSELNAFRTSALLWLELYGPTGKAQPIDELERQMNLVALQQQRDPASLEEMVRQAYSDQCSTQ